MRGVDRKTPLGAADRQQLSTPAWRHEVLERGPRPVLVDADDGATLDELREAVEILESVAPVWTRIFGAAHPETRRVKLALAAAREILARALASAAPAAGSAEEKS